MQSNNYWSSSENNANNAWNFNADNGNWNNDNKDNDNLVRACLAYWVITCMRSDKPRVRLFLLFYLPPTPTTARLVACKARMAQSEDLPIFKASYDLLEQLTDLAKDLPKFFRYSIGQRMVDLCLDLLGNIYRANMKRDKAEPLTDLLIDYRQLLLLLRVCYRQKALSTGRYAELVKLLDSIGRQATGWRQKYADNE